MPYKLKPEGDKFCVVNADTGKTLNCHDSKAKALRQLRAVSANEKSDAASERRVECYELNCGRAWPSFGVRGFDAAFQAMVDHAEAVHSFDDIRRQVQEAVREEYGSTGTSGNTWVWIEDLADDWVVFQVEAGPDTRLLKASYSLVDGVVTLGDPTEVRRRTVYEPINKK